MRRIELGGGWFGPLTDDRRSLALLIVVQLIVVQLIVTAVVQPRGDFPLNDDWAYAHSVRWLLDEHRIIEQPSAGRLFTPALISSIGVLERQVVIVILFAFMVAWLWSQRPWLLRTVAIGVGPFAAAMAVEVAYHTYLVLGPGVPAAQ